jgi:hypothetical protein
MDISINYWAVLVCGVAYMVIGSLWYGPLFGRWWMKQMGYSAETMGKPMANGMTAWKAMGLGLLSALVMANVLAHEVFIWHDYAGMLMSQAALALQVAFWLWLGFVATTQLGAVLWEGRSWKLFLFNASHALVALIAMAFILVYWM